MPDEFIKLYLELSR